MAMEHDVEICCARDRPQSEWRNTAISGPEMGFEGAARLLTRVLIQINARNPVPTANPKRLTAIANWPILAPDERSLRG